MIATLMRGFVSAQMLLVCLLSVHVLEWRMDTLCMFSSSVSGLVMSCRCQSFGTRFTIIICHIRLRIFCAPYSLISLISAVEQIQISTIASVHSSWLLFWYSLDLSLFVMY